jgi:hypothetical protein
MIIFLKQKKKDIEIGYFGETFVSGFFLECCLQGFDKIWRK